MQINQDILSEWNHSPSAKFEHIRIYGMFESKTFSGKPGPTLFKTVTRTLTHGTAHIRMKSREKNVLTLTLRCLARCSRELFIAITSHFFPQQRVFANEGFGVVWGAQPKAKQVVPEGSSKRIPATVETSSRRVPAKVEGSKGTVLVKIEGSRRSVPAKTCRSSN